MNRDLVFAVVVVLALSGSTALGENHYFDFRSRSLPDNLILFNAPEGNKIIRPENEGLRISIPESYIHPYGGIGAMTTFGVKGDFEITATYEILQADKPTTGFGVGLSLRVHKQEPSKEVANIARLVRAKGQQIVLCNRSLELPGKKPQYPEFRTPCTDKIGRLRLKRVGTALTYSHANGAIGEKFDEIHTLEFGADQIRRVDLVGMTGRQPCNMDARFLDLRIQDESVQALDQPQTGQAKTDPESDTVPRGWRTVAGLAVLATIFLLIAAAPAWWLFTRLRTTAKS